MNGANSDSSPPDISQEKPFLLLTSNGQQAGNKLRLLDYLSEEYDVEKEYATEYLQVYALTQQD